MKEWELLRHIGSGRVQVDFNHKYAGRTLIYDAKILKKLESEDEKITSLIKRRLPIDVADVIYEKRDSDLNITLPEKTFLLEGLQIIKRGIVVDLSKFIPEFKNFIFIEKYPNGTTPKSDTTNIAPSKDDDSKNGNEKETPSAATDVRKNLMMIRKMILLLLTHLQMRHVEKKILKRLKNNLINYYFLLI